MRVGFTTVLLVATLRFVKGKNNPRNIESYVVNGVLASIKDFPYTVALGIIDSYGVSITCGGSLLNQKIVLTAAHCFEDCINSDCVASAAVGTARSDGKPTSTVNKFVMHQHYNTHTVANDVCLISLRTPAVFSSIVKRVAISPERTKEKKAVVAGFGHTNEIYDIDDPRLMKVSQRIWTREKCLKIVTDVPSSAFCGGEVRSAEYPAKGDSGSALVVKGFLQIGLVSYKDSFVTRSLIVYTDISVLYDWIHKYSHRMYCF